MMAFMQSEKSMKGLLKKAETPLTVSTSPMNPPLVVFPTIIIPIQYLPHLPFPLLPTNNAPSYLTLNINFSTIMTVVSIAITSSSNIMLPTVPTISQTLSHTSPSLRLMLIA
jgi:hypothetical protein